MHAIAVWILALCVTGTAAVTDLRRRRIPNWLNAVGLLLAGLLHAVNGASMLRLAGVGLVVTAAVPSLLYWGSKGHALGGGDVKLFAVLGAMFGPFLGLEVQLLSYLVLLFFALCKLSYQGRLLRTLKNAAALLLHRVCPKIQSASDPTLFTSMRLGPSIFAACLLLALHSNVTWFRL